MCARVRVRACSRAGADYRGGKAEYREIPPMDSYLFITHLSSRALCRLQRGHSAAAQAPAPPPSLSVQDYSGGVGQRFKAIPPPLPSPFSPPRSAEYSGGGLRFEAFQVPRPPPRHRRPHFYSFLGPYINSCGASRPFRCRAGPRRPARGDPVPPGPWPLSHPWPAHPRRWPRAAGGPVAGRLGRRPRSLGGGGAGMRPSLRLERKVFTGG